MIDLWFGLICAVGGIIAGYTYGRYPAMFQRPVVLRTIPKEEAKEMILNYFKNDEEKWTSDVIFDLALDVDLVLTILDELRQEGKIEPRVLSGG